MTNARRFTLTHPIHIDLAGGIVRIVADNLGHSLKPGSDIKRPSPGLPLLGIRYDPDTGKNHSELYSADGRYNPLSDKPSILDLHDADLASIKPLLAREDKAA